MGRNALHSRDLVGSSDDCLVRGHRRPSIVDHVNLGKFRMAADKGMKVGISLSLPILLVSDFPVEPLFVSLFLSTNVNSRWSSLKDVELLGPLGKLRDNLNGSGSSSNDADVLALQVYELRIILRPTRATIVPSRGMEDVSLEIRNSWNVGNLGPVQNSGSREDEASMGHDGKLGTIRKLLLAHIDSPSLLFFDPFQRADGGAEKQLVGEVVFLGDEVDVVSNLLSIRIPVLGDVVHLFQEGQIQIALDIAHEAGVSVPVPSSSKATCLIDQTDVLCLGSRFDESDGS